MSSLAQPSAADSGPSTLSARLRTAPRSSWSGVRLSRELLGFSALRCPGHAASPAARRLLRRSNGEGSEGRTRQPAREQEAEKEEKPGEGDAGSECGDDVEGDVAEEETAEEVQLRGSREVPGGSVGLSAALRSKTRRLPAAARAS